MTKTRLFTLVFIFTLLLSALAPMPAQAAATGTSKLSISNRSGAQVIVTLKGPSNYTIVTVPGQNIKDINKGQYTYSYKSCGVDKKGTLKAAGAKTKLNIAPCQTATVLLINSMDSTLTLSLNGPNKYTFTVPANSLLRVKIWKGAYRYTASGCGTKSGTFQATFKAYRWAFWCN